MGKMETASGQHSGFHPSWGGSGIWVWILRLKFCCFVLRSSHERNRMQAHVCVCVCSCSLFLQMDDQEMVDEKKKKLQLSQMIA